MSIYDEIATQNADTKEQKIERMGPVLYESIRPGSSVLDVGCSSGYFAQLLIDEKNCRVDGIEIDPGDIKKAKSIVRNLYTFDIETPWEVHLPKEAKYDFIIFGDVLEHMKDPVGVLKMTKDYLAREGLVLVSIPNIAHVSVRLELLCGSFEYEKSGILDETHLKYFTLESFTNLAHTVGFIPIKTDYALKDYPKRTIEDVLSKAGLKSSEKFYQLMKQPEAGAFQYKFVLKPADKPLKNSQKSLVKPEKLRDQDLEAIEDENSQLKEQIENLSEKIRQLKIARQDIYDSRSYKLSKKISKASRLIKPTGKHGRK